MPTPVDPSDIGPVVVSEQDLATRVRELGEAISDDYAGRDLLMIAVLKGAFVFLADLTRSVTCSVEVDFMAVSSYGASTRSSGVVRIVKDLDVDIADRHVLIVEDIIDSGLTLRYLRKNLSARNPASLDVCALLVREGNQAAELDLKYVGFHIPPSFVVGYGLDVGEYGRNLRDVRRYDPASS